MSQATEQATGGEERTQLGARVPKSLHRRLRVYAATEGKDVQDVVAEAVDRLLTEQGY